MIFPRDTEGGAGHGSLILFGAEDVSDARRAVEVAIAAVTEKFGDVYGNPLDVFELQYKQEHLSYACNKAFGAPLGKAFYNCWSTSSNWSSSQSL